MRGHISKLFLNNLFHFVQKSTNLIFKDPISFNKPDAPVWLTNVAEVKLKT